MLREKKGSSCFSPHSSISLDYPWKSRCSYLSVHCINGWIAARIYLWILQATSGPDITFFQFKSAIILKSNTCALLFKMIILNVCIYIGFVSRSVWMLTSLRIELNQFRFANTCWQQDLKSLIVKYFNSFNISPSHEKFGYICFFFKLQVK